MDQWLENHLQMFLNMMFKEMEAVITVSEHATCKFHWHCFVSFTIKEKVEQILQAQVAAWGKVDTSGEKWVGSI